MNPKEKIRFTEPRLALWLMTRFASYDSDFLFCGDLREEFAEIKAARGTISAYLWCWIQVLYLVPSHIKNTITWRVIMFHNYFRIAIRNFMKNRMYSFINISGLAIGMAACLMIFMWVQDELSYDRFHKNANRIFRVERFINFSEWYGQVPITSGPYGPTLVNDYPEVENFVRIDGGELMIRDHRNMSRKENVYFVDNSIFQVFDFKLLDGDSNSALTNPNSVVLTRGAAKKYMDTDDALGKTLTVEWNGEPTGFLVTGILDEVPHNSHFHFDMLMSIENLNAERMSVFLNNFLHTYVLLAEDASHSVLEAKLPDFIMKYWAEEAINFLPSGVDINEIIQLKLQPLTDIHLYPAEQFEIEPQGNMASVLIFSAIAIFILLIACINFMNLSTARAKKRAKEVGIRKTIGANVHQLRAQFLGESLIMSCVAVMLAIVVIAIFLAPFNLISGKSLSLMNLVQGWNWIVVFAITLATGILAGLYPAFCLTAFKPVNVLKGSRLAGNAKSNFRRVTAVFQFIISIALIIGTITVYRQMQLFQNKSLGFDKENILIVTATMNTVTENFDAYRNLLLGDPRILSVTASSNCPGDQMYSDTMFRRDGTEENFNLTYQSTHYDYVNTFGFQMLHGRTFSREFTTDVMSGIIINESAAMKIGYTPEEAVGKKLYMASSVTDFIEFDIVGVTSDFHFKSLHFEIQPLAMLLIPDRMQYVSIRMTPGDVRQTVEKVQKEWEVMFPGELFEYRFLDDHLNANYQSEGQMQKLFMIFSSLSIFVACLGLLGLAAFSAEERTKEIGIRKAMGASSGSVVFLLVREFSKWVLLANLVAWPLAYWGMNQWLQNFPYRVDQGILTFVISAILALLVALLTVSFQSIRAGLSNPVDSLRYE